ncbi:hypothetical protein HK096_005345 [Nowakowskiella sp. JEL0078]|nr:hypothetical protein HK096_005345 [Nowakowskiella sp. JEL0078]
MSNYSNHRRSNEVHHYQTLSPNQSHTSRRPQSDCVLASDSSGLPPKPMLEDSQLKDSFKTLLETGMSSDVILIANREGDPEIGRKIPAHKLPSTILIARSKVFGDMFEHCNDNQKEIPLPFSSKVLDVILRYIYHGAIPDISHTTWLLMIELVIASDYLQLPSALEERFQDRMLTALVTGAGMSITTTPLTILHAMDTYSQTPERMKPVWKTFSDLILEGNRSKDIKCSWDTIIRLIKFGNINFTMTKFSLLIQWLRKNNMLGPEKFKERVWSKVNDCVESAENDKSENSEKNETDNSLIHFSDANSTNASEKPSATSLFQHTYDLEPHFPGFYGSFVWDSEDIDSTLTEDGKNRIAEVYEYLQLHKLSYIDLVSIERMRIFSPKTMLGVYRRAAHRLH